MLFPNVSENCPLSWLRSPEKRRFRALCKTDFGLFYGKNERPARLTGRWEEDYGAASTATMRPSP